ncbi:MAG: HD domain-containing phosphohydrolase, partial [Bacillota bacterium]
MGQYSPELINQISGLLEIGISILEKENTTALLETILSKALQVTNSDAGTVFLKEDETLSFQVMYNQTLNVAKRENINLPDVKINHDNIAGYAVLEKEILNIADVYNLDKFDFSGPKKYDSLTGYQTKSMLVVPMDNHEGEVIGVLQLINAKNKSGEIIKFPTYLEQVVSFLASQAAISLSHFWALEDVENLLDSYVRVMATAIDARTPYNASHTQQIVNMLQQMIKKINNSKQGKLAQVEFDHQETEQLIMAAWLHDIGKIAIPLEIMNKSTRLGAEKLELILQRLDYIISQTKINYLEHKLNNDSTAIEHRYNKKIALIKNTKQLITKANQPTTNIDAEFKNKLIKISNLIYQDENNENQRWLKKSELLALTTSQGTLTKKEREIIESHVQISTKILAEVPFPDKLDQVIDWVALHHELLDGSGYPQGLSGSDIPLEARILTVLDIFEALISPERPYKQAKTIKETLKILDEMAHQGQLD